jgi:hypothetical protein
MTIIVKSLAGYRCRVPREWGTRIGVLFQHPAPRPRQGSRNSTAGHDRHPDRAELTLATRNYQKALAVWIDLRSRAALPISKMRRRLA